MQYIRKSKSVAEVFSPGRGRLVNLAEHGAAEILGYLALTDEDLQISVHDQDETVIDYTARAKSRTASTPA